MTRTLIVPAAGVGSRLGLPMPKLLVPVLGRPMIDHLFGLYESYVDQVVLVLNPGHGDAVREHLEGAGRRVDIVWQLKPTGMLDAVLLAGEVMDAAAQGAVWITWCDQVAVHPATVQTLAAQPLGGQGADLIFPTAQRRYPYIHLVRSASGEITRISHRREGDTMPEVGESDTGLFALSRRAYTQLLPVFAREVEAGQATRERNFLPFIPWLAGKAVVRTFPCLEEIESVGINTPEDLLRVERSLAARAGLREGPQAFRQT